MTVDLQFDRWVDVRFFLPFPGDRRLPLELMKAIGKRKNEIHNSLIQGPGSPEERTGAKIFELTNGDRFLVGFVTDLLDPAAEVQPLRVTNIEKLRKLHP